jgi:hypothetical protein
VSMLFSYTIFSDVDRFPEMVGKQGCSQRFSPKGSPPGHRP